MIVLGLHKDPWHNTGAAMIREDADGVRFANLSEERANREKDSRKFPCRSIQACMNQLGVSAVAQIDLVVLDYIVRPRWSEDWIHRPCDCPNFLNGIDVDRGVKRLLLIVCRRIGVKKLSYGA